MLKLSFTSYNSKLEAFNSVYPMLKTLTKIVKVIPYSATKT